MHNTQYSSYFTADEAREFVAGICADVAADYLAAWMEAPFYTSKRQLNEMKANHVRWAAAAVFVRQNAAQSDINAVINGTLEIFGMHLASELVYVYLKDKNMLPAVKPTTFNLFSAIGALADRTLQAVR